MKSVHHSLYAVKAFRVVYRSIIQNRLNPVEQRKGLFVHSSLQTLGVTGFYKFNDLLS